MEFGLYEWVYILTSIFGIYILYRFMGVFFDARRTSARVELLSYIVCCLIVNSIYLLINIPAITMLANLTAFFLLSFNYESTIKKRLLSTVLIYVILMIVELIVALLSGYLNSSIFAENYYSSVFGVICINILQYFVVLILNNFKNIKKGECIPNAYWFCIILIPSGSIITIVILLNAQGLTVSQILAALILIFLINTISFHLYDVICRCLTREEKEPIKNCFYIRQMAVEELQVKYEKRGVK